MTTPTDLLEQNRAWAARVHQEQPALFEELSEGQAPDYLWIGCADSRVPPSQIVDCDPGELFVHRNIANRLAHGDLNGLSVLKYAVEVLRVPHVVVCGHYQCGGVQAAMEPADHGLIDPWLRPIRRLRRRRQAELETLEGTDARWNRLCELNVLDQVRDLAHSPLVRNAWRRGQELTLHGWIYELGTGRIRDLEVALSSPDQAAEAFRTRASDSGGE